MPIKFTAVEQHFDPYRSNYLMSPQSQLSPMSPQNRNATPSPISPSPNGAYTDQLCTLMQDSTIETTKCQTLDAIFNGRENQEFDYNARGNINAYNDNTNYQITNGHYLGTVRNTTSGGYFQPIKEKIEMDTKCDLSGNFIVIYLYLYKSSTLYFAFY